MSWGFDKPGITITAYDRINPVAKAQNKTDKNNDISKKFTYILPYNFALQIVPIVITQFIT